MEKGLENSGRTGRAIIEIRFSFSEYTIEVAGALVGRGLFGIADFSYLKGSTERVWLVIVLINGRGVKDEQCIHHCSGRRE